MSSGPNEPAPKSPGWGLRWRLVLSTTAVLAFSLAAAFIWAHFNLRSVLLKRADSFLENKSRELASILSTAEAEEVLRELEREVEVYETDGLTVVLSVEGEKPVFAPKAGTFADRAAEVLNRPLASTPTTVVVEGGTRPLRALRMDVQTAKGKAGTLQVSMSIRTAEATLAQFDRRLAFGGLALLVLALPGGLWLYRQALRPVTAAVHAASLLDPADMTARLPRSGSGDELDQLADTINDLLERLATYHSRIIRFTADASHELRTPLATMQAAIEVALGQDRASGDYVDLLASIGRQCERLTSIVNGLQLLARGDAGQLQLEKRPVDLTALAKECVELFLPLAEDRGVALRCVGEAVVVANADANRLRQVLTNLVDNALKFTPGDGSVTLTTSTGNGRAVVEVADTGAGVQPDALPHLFERFYRADGARTAEGSGLGLSICRTIVQAHGGSITATSMLAAGSTFRVELPVAGS